MKLQIESLVREYGQQGVEEIASDLGINARKKFKCAFNDHNDKHPSMSLIKGSETFYCFSCQRKYNIINHYVEYYGMSYRQAVDKLKTNLGYETIDIKEDDIKKVIEKENKEIVEYMQGLEKMFKFKKISLQTLLENGITDRTKDGKSQIGVTYRRKKEIKLHQWVDITNLKQRIYGEKDLLFNYDNIKDDDDIIICFDIMDYLTMYELGYRNICSKSHKGNGFVAKYYDDLKKHKKITLIFGNDVSNNTFNRIIKRIGVTNVKYRILKNHHTINHAVVDGLDMDVELKKAKYVEIESLKRLEDITFENSKQEQIRFGQQSSALSGLDWLLDGVRLSTLNLIYGRDNEGKTSITQQMMCNMIEQGHGIFLYDGESNQATLKRKFYLRLVGGEENATITKKVNIRPIQYPKDTVVEALEQWHENKLIIRGSEMQTDIFEDMEKSYKRYGTKIYVIDNLMSILELGNQNRNNAQSSFVEKMKRFAKINNVAVILIAHARQTEENVALTKMDVSGSKEITDKADNVISFMRDFKERHDKFDGEVLDADVTNIMDVLKNREFGEFGRFLFKFNKTSGNFDEIITNQASGTYNEIRENVYTWKDYLKADVDRNTYEKIKVKEIVPNSPF